MKNEQHSIDNFPILKKLSNKLDFIDTTLFDFFPTTSSYEELQVLTQSLEPIMESITDDLFGKKNYIISCLPPSIDLQKDSYSINFKIRLDESKNPNKNSQLKSIEFSLENNNNSLKIIFNRIAFEVLFKDSNLKLDYEFSSHENFFNINLECLLSNDIISISFVNNKFESFYLHSTDYDSEEEKMELIDYYDNPTNHKDFNIDFKNFFNLFLNKENLKNSEISLLLLDYFCNNKPILKETNETLMLSKDLDLSFLNKFLIVDELLFSNEIDIKKNKISC